MYVDISVAQRVCFVYILIIILSAIATFTLLCFTIIISYRSSILVGAGWAFQCANKLLADGEIDHIVFFTESAKTVNAAKTLISSNYLDRLIIPGKMYVNDTMKHVDSMDMRDPDEMSTAVSEW